MMNASLMIQVERRAGTLLAAAVCAAVLTMAAHSSDGQSDTHKKKAPPPHEPTSAELFDYIHGAMLAYSPADQVNDNLEISIDPTATVLTIKQPDGHCDNFPERPRCQHDRVGRVRRERLHANAFTACAADGECDRWQASPDLLRHREQR